MFNYYIGAMKNYANFKGRARRSEYWYTFLVYLILSIIAGILDVSLGLVSESGNGPFGAVVSLVHLVPMIAMAARRMHDVDRSGWFQLIPFYSFYLCVKNGDVGTNRFGEDPKTAIANVADTFN
jgi:uncharacterized membrane protein YhaH (DUF805 family)